MAIILDELLTAYLADPKWREYRKKRTETRNAVLPQITEIATQFANGTISLQTFCSQLSETFRITGERWGAQGNSFLLPLYKIIKHHDDKAPVAEPALRQLLLGLNASNMGERIEQLYQFLLEERTRLRQEGKPSGVAAEAGKSAMIISLFTFWLHPEQQTVIYHEGVRHGLAMLIKKQLLTPPSALRINRDVVTVLTNDDHHAFLQALDELLEVNPAIQDSAYWSEYFFYWTLENLHRQSALALIDVQDESIISSSETIQAGTGHETQEMYHALSYDNDPLVPTPEPLLTDLIHEVQRHILVEEPVIRRIYHALLAGHVVLSGPPGTGKTELARLLPEILWRGVEDGIEENGDGNAALSGPSAYTTRLVTATDEWSVRTLISGITPISKNGSVAYKIQYGHLTSAILKNWSAQGNVPEEWSTLTLRRIPVTSSSGVDRGTLQTFRGQWLIIDEFNRAPIDLALGEALTALGGNDVLRVMTEDGSMELPIPKDFRVIGTLNSFDRNYLNQISEALKRRFSFIEILPPGRKLREAEQAMVLHKALNQVTHLRQANNPENELFPWDTLAVEADLEGPYIITWPDEPYSFREAFEAAWRIFEIIRVYRQLGTAQAISLVRHMLIAGIVQGYTTREQWIGEALDAALCDTIADQLQVLLPDEIETLLLALTCERAAFCAAYNRLLANLSDRQQRLYGQLLSLGSISDEHGTVYLSDEEIEASAQSSPPTVVETKLRAIFHLDAPLYRLPQFTRRLRAFKAERGL